MQPYLFPYVGYFQLMAAVDTFVLLDDVSFINRGWINRNRIAVNGQPLTFTVPLEAVSQNKRINEISLVKGQAWRQKLLKTVEQTYRKSTGFEQCFPVIKGIVEDEEENLSAYVRNSLTALKDWFGLKAHIEASSASYGNRHLSGEARIIDICKQEGAKVYINLAGGVDLYDKAHFATEGMELKFLKAAQVEYKQGRHDFISSLSIIDLMMGSTRQQLQRQLRQHELF
jgi:hypothetical protein